MMGEGLQAFGRPPQALEAGELRAYRLTLRVDLDQGSDDVELGSGE
jgi:hypothetical protein